MFQRSLAPRFAALAGLLTAAVLAVPSTAEAAGYPPPDQDPFYAQPDDIADAEPGEILDVRSITAILYAVPVPAQAWQIKYRSADNTGKPPANVTTLMVPKAAWKGPGPRPLVSHQVAEDSAGINCAPSYGFSSGILAGHGSIETGLAALGLSRGWAVVFPDYQGPDAQFLGGKAEARGVLDSLKAVRAFAPAGLQDSPIGLDGYSGGAIASTWAAQYQSEYAPELPIKGVALGGVVADYRSTIKQFHAFGLNGIVMMGVGAVSRAYPEADLTQYLNDKGKAVLSNVERDCLVNAQAKYPIMNLNSLTVVPNIFDHPPVVSFLRSISPLGVEDTPSAPVYMFHGTIDELAPIKPARELFRKFCDAGVPVKKVELPLLEHMGALAGFPAAYQYLADRFAGKPVPSTC